MHATPPQTSASPYGLLPRLPGADNVEFLVVYGPRMPPPPVPSLQNTTTMRIPHFAQVVAALAIAFSGAANATIPLSGEYSVTSFASGVGANMWQFDYSVTNNNQGLGGYTGLDGFTIFIPESATVIDSVSPAPFNGSPGYWSASVGTGLTLLGNGSADLAAPVGYKSFTWWGSDPSSVYTVGSTAMFSVTLGNVSVGSNTVGITTYFGGSVPTQEHTQN